MPAEPAQPSQPQPQPQQDGSSARSRSASGNTTGWRQPASAEQLRARAKPAPTTQTQQATVGPRQHSTKGSSDRDEQLRHTPAATQQVKSKQGKAEPGKMSAAQAALRAEAQAFQEAADKEYAEKRRARPKAPADDSTHSKSSSLGRPDLEFPVGSSSGMQFGPRAGSDADRRRDPDYQQQQQQQQSQGDAPMEGQPLGTSVMEWAMKESKRKINAANNGAAQAQGERGEGQGVSERFEDPIAELDAQPQAPDSALSFTTLAPSGASDADAFLLDDIAGDIGPVSGAENAESADSGGSSQAAAGQGGSDVMSSNHFADGSLTRSASRDQWGIGAAAQIDDIAAPLGEPPSAAAAAWQAGGQQSDGAYPARHTPSTAGATGADAQAASGGAPASGEAMSDASFGGTAARSAFTGGTATHSAAAAAGTFTGTSPAGGADTASASAAGAAASNGSQQGPVDSFLDDDEAPPGTEEPDFSWFHDQKFVQKIRDIYMKEMRKEYGSDEAIREVLSKPMTPEKCDMDEDTKRRHHV